MDHPVTQSVTQSVGQSVSQLIYRDATHLITLSQKLTSVVCVIFISRFLSLYVQHFGQLTGGGIMPYHCAAHHTICLLSLKITSHCYTLLTYCDMHSTNMLHAVNAAAPLCWYPLTPGHIHLQNVQCINLHFPSNILYKIQNRHISCFCRNLHSILIVGYFIFLHTSKKWLTLF